MNGPVLLALAISALRAFVTVTAAGMLQCPTEAHTHPDEKDNLPLQISDKDGSLARTYLSPAHQHAAAQLKSWMGDAGMETWVDAVGNVHGRVNGSNPDAPAILIGSHYDTVLDGGRYDGALGIIVGISAIKALVIRAALESGAELGAVAGPGQGEASWAVPDEMVRAAAGHITAPVHLVAFADEEGIRFQSTFLGSRALAGTLVSHGMLQSRDKSGATLEEVLQQHGVQGDVSAAVQSLALAPTSVREYIEFHMEQGPVLERQGVPLGVVSAIAGQSRLWVTLNGTQGHAGTVPMAGRVDPLAAAAEVILLVERRCGGGPAAGQGDGVITADASEGLVCTVGEVHVWPGASNVIPGSVRLSLDIRAKGDALRATVVANISQSIQDICAARGAACSVERTHDAGAVLSDNALVAKLTNAIKTSSSALKAVLNTTQCSTAPDVSEAPEEHSCSWDSSSPASQQESPDTQAPADVPILVSGAGHDAMALAPLTKMAMVFVRCQGGISHSPLEHVEPHDVAAAATALAEYLQTELLRPAEQVH